MADRRPQETAGDEAATVPETPVMTPHRPNVQSVFVPVSFPVTLGNGASAGPSETLEVDVNDRHNAVLLEEGHLILSSSIVPGDDAE